MGSLLASWSCFLLYVLLVSQYTSGHRWVGMRMHDVHLQSRPHDQQVHMHGEESPSEPPMDPSFNLYFTTTELKKGNRIPIYFPANDPSTSPRLLPREESDSIPFSLSHLPELLDFFSFPLNSPQAKAMEYTLSECESHPLRGETRFCANSLESMLDSVRDFFGAETQFHALTTKFLCEHTALLQNYTLLDAPKVVETLKMVGCHTMPYPYAVFYCHGQEGDGKMYQLSMEGDNGERVEVVGVCHVDTSDWDPNHSAFRVLKTRPGESPVCHVFPADNVAFVESENVIELVV